jgi:hypothetical protein
MRPITKIRGFRDPVILGPAVLTVALGACPAVDQERFRHEHAEREGPVWAQPVGKLTIQAQSTSSDTTLRLLTGQLSFNGWPPTIAIASTLSNRR